MINSIHPRGSHVTSTGLRTRRTPHHLLAFAILAPLLTSAKLSYAQTAPTPEPAPATPAPTPSSAPGESLPPAPVVALAPPQAASASSAPGGNCGPTANCTVNPATKLGTCKALPTDDDVRTYACYEWLATKTCQAARDTDVPRGSRLNPHEQLIVEDFIKRTTPTM